MEEKTQNFDENLEEGSFAAMFEESMVQRPELIPGAKIEATILQIGAQWVFLDVGQKGEGVLDLKELLDGEGNHDYQAGDKISAYFVSGKGGELRFTTRVGSGSTGLAQLEDACHSGIPVEGTVAKEIKGGFEISLPGSARGFCPFSQLGLPQLEQAADAVGQSLPFRITQFSNEGRNIVVSHRAIVEEEKAQLRDSLKETLKVDDVVSGTVRSIRDFGAFVDIGGIDGLLPISEISFGRVENIEDYLQVGQQIEVAVKKLDWQENRFSFSLRDTLTDPWSRVADKYPVGSTHKGKVSRLATFGAFITLEEGVDGLIHISKLGSGRRLRHAQDVLKTGEYLDVVIDKVDTDERRISLVKAEDGDGAENETSYIEAPSSAAMGSFADLFNAGAKDKKREKRSKKRR